ncbi:alpha-hydroxy acid oxidase [Aspergillus candidus]|uniref:Oxidase FUB9 n=1 Tax=Aspergillus candidus TaxID=41067 RepID=A0A2I2F0T4_ASPCN|nr:2-hydroxy-acid oxidase [Aspergillus candidus]PLB34243.1 2-hydroxy-acid oxidase [Aspergillus candidus]
MADLNSPSMMLCVDDIKQAASKKLPQKIKDFYNSGSTHQITVAENSTAYNKYRLRPRVLVDVSPIDTTTTVLDQRIDFPLGVAPTGLQAMAHPSGELATSRACARRHVPMGVSTFCNHAVEDVTQAARATGFPPISHAMQLYSMRDRAHQERIIRRAEAAGCKAIFLTADSPVLGVRYSELRNGFRTPADLALPMLEQTWGQDPAQTHVAGFAAFNEDAHSWAREIPWLRSVTKLQIWIKGVLTAEDVALAREYGVDGVVVSNHGGRQLDDTPATIDVLPECVRAAAGKIPVHIDGGIRTGTDIFKALALGAQCCWIGRPTPWGLAYDGENGVSKVLDILYDEFKRCMQLTGCVTVADITPACLGVVRSDGPMARL